MNIRKKIILTTLIFAIPAIFLSKILWPLNPMTPTPTPAQLPLIVALGILESLSFGVGMSFLIFGYRSVSKITGKDKNLTFLTYLSIGWLLINWWPHDNWHAANGMDLAGLIVIEYIFHVTLIIAGLILAYAFFNKMFHRG